LNIIDKAIYEDIAAFYNLRTSNLIVFKKLLFFLATITPGEININKLSSSLGKDNKTVLEYLHILNDAGFIQFLLSNKNGHSFARSLEKIYIDNTALLYVINYHLGKPAKVGQVREIFALNQLRNAGYRVGYTPNGDFMVENKYALEIGGKNKDSRQIRSIKNSFLVLDDIAIADKDRIPLYLFGFLY
jgi:predicted AAA+ superfamily ATPase